MIALNYSKEDAIEIVSLALDDEDTIKELEREAEFNMKQFEEELRVLELEKNNIIKSRCTAFPSDDIQHMGGK